MADIEFITQLLSKDNDSFLRQSLVLVRTSSALKPLWLLVLTMTLERDFIN